MRAGGGGEAWRSGGAADQQGGDRRRRVFEWSREHELAPPGPLARERDGVGGRECHADARRRCFAAFRSKGKLYESCSSFKSDRYLDMAQ